MIREKLSGIKIYLLYAIAFSIACFIYAAPIIICLFAVAWLAEGRLKEKIIKAARNRFVWLFWAFYLLHLVGMLYTPYAKAGWFDLQVKISLFLFPFFLASEGKMEFKQQKRLIWAFIIGLIINGCICLIHALWLLLVKNIFQFQYSQFSLFLHPSYYTMYIAIAIVLIFYILDENRKAGNKRENTWLYVSFFFLEFIIVLLQSKMGMIVSATVIIIIVVKYMIKKNPLPTAIILIFGIAAMYYISYHYIITSGRSRILSAEERLNNPHLSDTTSESNQVRVFIYRASWNIIKKAPVIGSGTGAVHQVLENEYAKEGMIGALKKKLNAHNQYIETTLELGIPGLLVFLASLFIPIYIALRQKRFIYFMFLFIFMANILVESMLEVQSGTIFYGFFNSLLMFNFLI